MAWYAAEGEVGTAPIDGGIEISAEQYQSAIEAMLVGKIVTVEGGFDLIDPPEQAPLAEPEPEPIDLTAYAAQKRWEMETGGIEVGGMTVYTDDRSKMMIMGARIAATADPGFATQWKAADGSFVEIDAATIIAISDAVLAHVDACFAIEAQVLDGIGNETITSTAEIDAAFAA